MAKIFLQAEWRKLAMANYAVSPSLLKGYLPHGTELDFWNGTCYVSLVGFMFLNTKVMGFKVPYHINFEEINLRFYVKYNQQGEWKRGVVFIKEIVPRPALTLVANLMYGENYETLPTTHTWEINDQERLTEYRWKKGEWNSLKVITEKEPVAMISGSEEEFITEHFWGYTRINDGRTSEYQVEHPTWQLYPVKKYEVKVDFAKVYGEAFRFLSTQSPLSVFLAEGSEIIVRKGAAL